MSCLFTFLSTTVEVSQQLYIFRPLINTIITMSLLIIVTKRQCDWCWSVLAKYNWETIFCGHYRPPRFIFKHSDVNGLRSYRIWWNNAKWGLLSRSFELTDVGTNRKPICDFLLVINTNWHLISYRFKVFTDYCLNSGHLHFWALAPLGA